MSKILIVGDIHISEKAIPEIEKIFKEILKIDADKFIQLGDYYDHNRPTPLELKFGTNLAKKLKKKYKDVTIISGTGTHDLLNNCSIIEYFKEIGINTIKGNYIENNILYGHFMLHESKLSYGSGRCGIKDLAKYNFVFLGHLHPFQELKKDKMFHPGSTRFINFNESVDPFKRVILLEDDKVKFIKLDSPIPMRDVKSVKELSKLLDSPFCKKCLLPIDGDCMLTTGICVFCHYKSMEWDSNGQLRTKGEAIWQGYKMPIKVRIVISSFEQFKNEINQISKFKDKFVDFKIKLQFSNTVSEEDIKKEEAPKKKRLEDILREGIAKIEDDDVKKLLLEQMEEE